MDRLRRSLRDSFRKKKDSVPECSKPHQWQSDDAAVRNSTCSFSVKYLGCVEVFESRGMQVCEEALKVLRNSKRRPVKGTLYVTGDGLRVVDDETKGLIVDQTIEKVSFCAPDRNCDKGFSYICRDGTTRRWMCHGFLAVKDTGERLSHAVGCAFAVCLERKQKRDKESVVMAFDSMTSTFTRTGSFRQTSLTERMQDPQECKLTEPPPIKPVCNPYAVERPHASAVMIQRQGSFRGFTTLNQTSPFKRQLSLRLNELPSTIERQRAMTEHGDIPSLQNGLTVASIPESSPTTEKQDIVSVMCQQVSHGLSLLNKKDEHPVSAANMESHPSLLNHNMESANNQWPGDEVSSRADTWLANTSVSLNTGNYKAQSFLGKSPRSMSANSSELIINNPPAHTLPSQPVVPPRHSSPNFSHLQKETTVTLHKANSTSEQSEQDFEVLSNSQNNGLWGTRNVYQSSQSSQGSFNDPFDAEWAAIAGRNNSNTNPFVQHSVKAFEVHM